MDMERSNRITHVFLSDRNLKVLLSKLDWNGSHRTISRQMENGDVLIVTAETDEVHYLDREPGEMHPRSEEAIR